MATQSTPARDLGQIVTFAALIAALTVIGTIPLGVVPLTLQTLGVLLAGAVLGARKGALAVALYLAVGAIGVPVFAGGASGIAAFVGPTGGFLLGFVLAAWLVGFLTERIMPAYPFWRALGVTVLGSASVYLIGIPWLVVTLGTPAVVASLAVFIPGDLLKAVLAVVIATSVHRALPDLFPTSRQADTSAPADAATSPVTNTAE